VRPELAVGEEIGSGLHDSHYTCRLMRAPEEKPALSCSYVRIRCRRLFH
jgi:hypothetical protein